MANISKDFTIEDIHKIREEHYEREKVIGKEARNAEIKKAAEKFEKRIEEIRKKKGKVS